MTERGMERERHTMKRKCIFFTYNYRYYSPELGRWLSRDPSQELNSINLYLFCQNNCIEKYDHLGLWLGETHRKITRSAFSSIRLIEISRSNNCDIIVIGKIKEQLISIVIASNVNTDSGETGKQQEYHYCSQMNWTHLQAIEKYKATLASNVGDLNKILNQKGYLDESKCIDALETLGLLTHMWQDYYAHGVERDDSWFGAQVGTLRGSPDAIDFTYLPVTFGLMGFRGGHGGFFRIINPFSHVEPGDRATDAANRRNQAMIFTRNKLVIYLNKWIKKCKCVYKNMLNVVIVVLWLLTLSYNLNANEIEMKLVKTIESNPTYMSFDEMEKSLILCFIDDENKVKYQEYNIASQKINKINNRVPTGVPKLINKVKFVTECQLYKKDDYGEHQVDKTDLWFFGYSSNIILKKKNTTGYEVVWSMPLGKDRRCECIFRSDSVFPYLLIEDDGQWMIYDSKDKSLIKTIKIVSNVFVHQIYLSEFLDNIVSENKIDDIDFATTIFIPKEDWQKKVKENRLTLPPLLSFFPDDNGFSKNEAKFKFQLLAPYRYEGLCFLDRNTVGMIISIGTRMRLTGETRLLLYHFDKNIIFVNKRITPNMCFSPKRFTPDNIAFSQNGKYLAYCYDKKIYIYQLNQSSKED